MSFSSSFSFLPCSAIEYLKKDGTVVMKDENEGIWKLNGDGEVIS